MAPLIAIARRRSAVPPPDLSRLCWDCAIARRRQLRQLSSHPQLESRKATDQSNNGDSESSPGQNTTSSIRKRWIPSAAQSFRILDTQSLVSAAPCLPENRGTARNRSKASRYRELGQNGTAAVRDLKELLEQSKELPEQQHDTYEALFGSSTAAPRASVAMRPLRTGSSPLSKRNYHTSRQTRQIDTVHMPHESSTDILPLKRDKPVRLYLEEWQMKYGTPNVDTTNEFDNPVLQPDQTANEIGLSSSTGNLDNNKAEEEEVQDILDRQTVGDFDGDADSKVFLKKGDLVEYIGHGHSEPVLAVFIRQFKSQSQFYTIEGQWSHRKLSTVQFTIPGFFDPSILDNIIPHLPHDEVDEKFLDMAYSIDTSVPRHIGAPVVSGLKDFAAQADVEYRRHAGVLETAHSQLAHHNDLRFGTLTRISSTLLQVKEPSWPQLYAVRKGLLHDALGFGFDSRSHRVTGVFQIRPTTVVRAFTQCADWIREWQEEEAQLATASQRASKSTNTPPDLHGSTIVKSFASKARRLIAKSRAMRGPPLMGRVGVSKVQNTVKGSVQALKDVWVERFTTQEQTIIRFLEAWCLSTLFKSTPRMAAMGPLLLRAVGVYDDVDLNTTTGFSFLQEIGVLVPHENRLKFDPHLLLPTAQHSKQLESMSIQLVAMRDDSARIATVDTMQDLRKEWKDFTCFCIDSHGAEEIDDGISVERIANSSDHWVHVHVANPTAFLDRGHLISRMAAHLTETIYMPEKTYAMLPKWLTQSRLSLASGRPVLTFSIRLSQGGDLLDVKIQPGRVSKVVSLTPSQVQKITDNEGALLEADAEETVLQVGKTHPSIWGDEKPKPKRLSEQEIKDLRTLHKLALARSGKRTAAGGLQFSEKFPKVTVLNNGIGPGLPWSYPTRKQARFIEGDPVIRMKATYSGSWFSNADRGPEFIVREMMLLAGEAGAKWCKDRNVPIIFRGSVQRADIMSLKTFEETVLKPSMDEKGTPSLEAGLDYVRHIGSSIASTTPHPHRFLGTQQYAKLTSPLRRFGDMMIHWQIESALRQEAKLGRPLNGTENQDWLTFSKDEVDLVTGRLTPRERLITRTKKASIEHWIAQLFYRAFYHQETEIPEVFEVFVVNIPSLNYGKCGAIVKEYSFDVNMELPSPSTISEEARIGDTWQVRIKRVDSYNRKVTMEPIRLVSRERGN